MSPSPAPPLPPVAETLRQAGLGDDAAALAEDSPTPRVFLDRLFEAFRYADAARYLAFALRKREAVWWACRCARSAPGGPRASDAGPAADALDAAERWAADPSEENRRAAGAFGEAAVGTPSGSAALAAFWSGGSLAPKGLPDVPPADDLTARGVAAAVLISGVVAEPEKAPARYRQFCDIGLAVAEGSDRWPASGPATAPRPIPAPVPRPTAPPPPQPPSPRSPTTTRFRDTWE